MTMIDQITREVGRQFRCFVGGREPAFTSPIPAVFKDGPLQFAAGVDVRAVVAFVAERIGDPEAAYRDGYRTGHEHGRGIHLPRPAMNADEAIGWLRSMACERAGAGHASIADIFMEIATVVERQQREVGNGALAAPTRQLP